jgi:hypothetical protein
MVILFKPGSNQTQSSSHLAHLIHLNQTRHVAQEDLTMAGHSQARRRAAQGQEFKHTLISQANKASVVVSAKSLKKLGYSEANSIAAQTWVKCRLYATPQFNTSNTRYIRKTSWYQIPQDKLVLNIVMADVQNPVANRRKSNHKVLTYRNQNNLS